METSKTNSTPTTTNTSKYSKDVEELIAHFRKTRQGVKTSAPEQAETSALPKDEEKPSDAKDLNSKNEARQSNSPATEELKVEESKPVESEEPKPLRPIFGCVESYDSLLSLFLRDESYFKSFGKWMKAGYFAPFSPAVPLETHRLVFEKAKEFYDEHGELFPRQAVDDAVKAHLETGEFKDPKLSERDREEKIKPWREFPDKLYAENLDLAKRAYTRDEMIKFLKTQATRETLAISHRETLGWTSFDASANLKLSERLAEIANIGKDNEPLKIRTCKDVDETQFSEADDWFAVGLIAKNDINLWYGPPGGDKSHLFWFLGNAINDGNKECLGIEICQTPVTYLDLENTKRVRGHFKRVLGDGDMRLITLDDDIEIPPIDSSPEQFEEFILTQIAVGIVCIDTTAMITRQTKFAESKWEADPIIRVLRRLCAKGYTFVLIFHSLKADPKTIKGPQELIGRAGHIVSIYSVPDAGKIEEKEDEEADPNKPKTLFVGTGANLNGLLPKLSFEKPKFRF